MTLLVRGVTSFAVLANHVERHLQLSKSMNIKPSIIGCKKYLDSYIGTDWKNYILNDSNKPYSRNKVLERDDFDIYVLTWNPKSRSKIHDHPEAGCLMRVMNGNIFECKYSLVNDKLAPMSYLTLDKDSNTSYIHNDFCYHEVGNSRNEIGVSIHIYSPKNYTPKVIYK
jgi:hypothetical protein